MHIGKICDSRHTKSIIAKQKPPRDFSGDGFRIKVLKPLGERN